MFMRILVHIRNASHLHKGDAKGEVVVEREYDASMFGEMLASNDAAKAVDEAIDKWKQQQERMDNDTILDS